MKRFLILASLLPFIAASAFGQSGTKVTGTFLTPGVQTPQAAGLRSIATIGNVAVYGRVDFTPMDFAGNRVFAMLCNGITYVPQPVPAWLKGDGTLMDNAGGTGVTLAPTLGCQPAHLVQRAKIYFPPSPDGRIPGADWVEYKELPNVAAADWGALAPASPVPAAFTYLFADNGTVTTHLNYTCETQPGNAPTGTLRVFCDIATGHLKRINAVGVVVDFEAGGGGGGSGTVTSVGLSLPAEFNVSGTPVIAAGVLSAVWATQAANVVFAGPGSGSAAGPGFRPMVALDLPGHTHAAGDITSGVLGIAFGGMGFVPSTPLRCLHVNAAGTSVEQMAGDCTTGGSGTLLNVNGSGLAAASANFNATTPAAPANSLNIILQADALTPTNISAYVPYTSPLTVSGGNLTLGIVPGNLGGTGIASYLLGDTLYASGPTTLARLPGNTTTNRKFWSQTGDGTNSAAPALVLLAAGDIPAHNHSAADITSGVGAVARGFTGLGSASNNTVMVGNGAAWLAVLLPDCHDAVLSKLLYNNSTQTVTCGTDQSGGGAPVTSVFGRSGAVVAAGGDYSIAQITPFTGISGTGTTAIGLALTALTLNDSVMWDGAKWINKAGITTFSAPLSVTANTLSIPAATNAVNGYLTSADWTTFNAKVATSRAINTTSPITGGGDLSADRTITCATCVVASAPGIGIAHFAGSTQTVTSSLVVAADITSNTITGAQLAASLSLVTPLLGTPTSGVLTNATGYLFNNLAAPTGNLSLAMAGNTSIFNTTSALSEFFAWKNTTAAVVGTSQGSPILGLCGRAWHGSADVPDCMTFSTLPGNGNDAAITFTIGHSGASTGLVNLSIPGTLTAGTPGVGVPFNFPSQSDPGSPNAGDEWRNNAARKFYDGTAIRTYLTDQSPVQFSVDAAPSNVALSPTASTTYYFPTNAATTLVTANTDVRVQLLMPTTGTVRAVYMLSLFTGGSASAVTFTLFKSAGGTGTPGNCNLTFTITMNSNPPQPGNDTAHTCAVTAGDTLELQWITPSGTQPTNVGGVWGVRVTVP